MTKRLHILRYSAIGLLAAGVAFAQYGAQSNPNNSQQYNPSSQQYGTNTGQQQYNPNQFGTPTGRATTSAAKNPYLKLEDMSTLLNLTPQQQTQAQQIFQSAWNSASQLMPQFKQNRDAIKSLLQTGNVQQFNSQIGPLSQKEGSLISDMIQIRTKAMEQFYSILTPQQRPKAAALYDLLTTHYPFRLQVVPPEPGTTGVPSE